MVFSTIEEKASVTVAVPDVSQDPWVHMRLDMCITQITEHYSSPSRSVSELRWLPPRSRFCPD